MTSRRLPETVSEPQKAESSAHFAIPIQPALPLELRLEVGEQKELWCSRSAVEGALVRQNHLTSQGGAVGS